MIKVIEVEKVLEEKIKEFPKLMISERKIIVFMEVKGSGAVLRSIMG